MIIQDFGVTYDESWNHSSIKRKKYSVLPGPPGRSKQVVGKRPRRQRLRPGPLDDFPLHGAENTWFGAAVEKAALEVGNITL